MSDSPATGSNTLNSLEIEKRKFEIEKIKVETEKLQLERRELNKFWLLKPQWWSVLVPLIIGAGTILIAFLTGIISVERLKNEKGDLEKIIEIKKDSIANLSHYKDSMAELVELARYRVHAANKFADSLKLTEKRKDKIIMSKNLEELQRIEQEIYMYEDHDSIYRQLDEYLKDTISPKQRQQKLTELRKSRDELKKILGM